MSQKKTIINDTDVERGIKEGKYIESGTQIRDVINGQIVKVLKDKNSSANSIPSTLIQVHHSYIYKADLKPIIDFISHSRESSIYESLEEQYNLALDYFDSYNTYGHNIGKVHEICLEISVSFDNKIRNEIENFDIDNIEDKNLSKFQGSLDAYIKILFSYIVSTYILHRENFSNDKVIIRKILSFEKNIRSLYEQLLAKSRPERKDGKIIEMFSMECSLYSMYLFDDNYNLHEIEDLVCQDSRFSSALQVVDFFKEHFKKGRFGYSNYYDNSYNEVKISVSTNRIKFDSKRVKLAKKLFQILEDIEKLKCVREEIVQLKDVDDHNILNEVYELSAG